MWPRRQMPVHSPLSARAVLAGWRAGASSGETARALEDLLLRRYGGSSVLLTDSGTSALTLALAGATLGSGNATVALPAYSCYDIVTAAVGAGVMINFYDIHPRTLAPDPDSFRRAVEGGATAAVIAYLYGIPIDLDEIVALCRSHGVFLIEDAAQAAGGRWRGRLMGSHGGVSVLSFGRGKGMTGGGGGALIAHDEQGNTVIQRARKGLEPGAVLRPMVTLGAQWILARPSLYGIPASIPFLNLGETVYREPSPPGSISPVSAAVVLRTVALVDRELQARRLNATRLTQASANHSQLRNVECPPGAEPAYLRFPVVVSPAAARSFSSVSARKLGVMPGYPRPLTQLDQAHGSLGIKAKVPGAEELSHHLFTLPTHSLLTENDLKNLEVFIRTTV